MKSSTNQTVWESGACPGNAAVNPPVKELLNYSSAQAKIPV